MIGGHLGVILSKEMPLTTVDDQEVEHEGDHVGGGEIHLGPLASHHLTSLKKARGYPPRWIELRAYSRFYFAMVIVRVRAIGFSQGDVPYGVWSLGIASRHVVRE